MSGLPLLSGPPPTINNNPEDVACRKCNKEFNFIFTRPRRCNHCGYTYCHNCTDYQALMPRSAGPGDSGYDPMNVCAFCIEYLPITAAGRGQLRSLPLSKLKKYAGAYNIPINGAVEKDDVINTLFAIRGGDGCLPPANEAFYRAHSVPNRSPSRPRGLFSSRPEPPPNLPPRPPNPPSRTEFSRPDLEPQPPHRPSPNYETRPTNSPPRNVNRHAQPLWGNQPHYTPPPPPPHPQYATYTRPQTTPPRPPSSSRPPPSTTSRPPPPLSASRPTESSSAPPPPPPPSLDELLTMSERNITSLPISSLKQILFLNRVNASNMIILEKSDLVKRVIELVEVERREREEREEREREEREEEERLIREVREREESEKRAREAAERRSRDGQQVDTTPDRRARVEDAPEEDESIHSSTPQEEIDILPPASGQESPPTPPPTTSTTSEPSASMKPPTKLPAKAHERNSGLCVICQDEDANIAIVDCGHMAMCRGCSELVMSSSRECPLCRTRIVTEARLLRIFKT